MTTIFASKLHPVAKWLETEGEEWSWHNHATPTLNHALIDEYDDVDPWEEEQEKGGYLVDVQIGDVAWDNSRYVHVEDFRPPLTGGVADYAPEDEVYGFIWVHRVYKYADEEWIR